MREMVTNSPNCRCGLFGLALFSASLGLGWSVLSGGMTLAAMMLPTLTISRERAYGSAVVLILLVGAANSVIWCLRRRFAGGG